MISGFNTDIEYDGVTYHVQTEDKGLETPLILSLVYAGGEILASKRSPYDDLIASGFDQKILTERLQRQHKLICAAIKQGRINDLRRMSMRKSSENRDVAQIVSVENVVVEPKKTLESDNVLDFPDEPLDIPVSILSDGNEISADNSFELLEDDGNLAPNKRNSSVPETEVSDTVADFANAEDLPAETLSLQLLDEQVYRGGERLSLKIVVYRRGNEPVSDAEIVVKVLGSAFRPQIFHAQTDPHGLAIVHLQLPHFRSGRAAILIRAVSNGYEAELRRIVTQS